jgi:hypothetical protein
LWVVEAGGHLREAAPVAADDAILLGGQGSDLLTRSSARLDLSQEGDIADLILDPREICPDLRNELARLRSGLR